MASQERVDLLAPALHRPTVDRHDPPVPPDFDVLGAVVVEVLARRRPRLRDTPLSWWVVPTPPIETTVLAVEIGGWKMSPDEAAATVVALAGADPGAAADRDELARLVDTSRRLRSWLDAYDVRCTRRARELADAGRAEPPESLHTRTGGRSTKESSTVTEREHVCASATTFEAALAAGQVTAGHLDAIAAALRGVDDDLRARFWDQEPTLLAIARQASVDSFTRKVRDVVRKLRAAGSDADELDSQRRNSRVKRWIDKVTGMHCTLLELDPVRDATVWSAVNAQLERLRHTETDHHRSFTERQADAVVAAVSAGQPARRIPQIVALVDHHTLVSGLHDAGVCETSDGVPLPVSTLRRMCCDADILPVVLDGDGRALDVGRSHRTATPAQRHALRAMHRTCGHPHCTVPVDHCRIHHVRWWWNHNGPTDLDNLLPLCEHHHHQVHEGRWTLTMTPDRIATWTRPDGHTAHHGPTVDRAPHGVAPGHDQPPDTPPPDRPPITAPPPPADRSGFRHPRAHHRNTTSS